MAEQTRLYRLVGAAAVKSVLHDLGFGSIAYPFDGNDPQEVICESGTVYLRYFDDIVGEIFINMDQRTAHVYIKHAEDVVRQDRLHDFYPEELGFDEPPDINVELNIAEIIEEVKPMAELPPPPLKRIRKHRRPRYITNAD